MHCFNMFTLVFYHLEKSLWPVQATIAEIPVPLRDWKSAVMVYGVWLAPSKPPRDRLLRPIIVQLQNLMKSKILLKQTNGKIGFL